MEDREDRESSESKTSLAKTISSAVEERLDSLTSEAKSSSKSLLSVSKSEGTPSETSHCSGHSPVGVKSLTPWQQWLLKKEVERREQTKNFKLLHKASTSPSKKVAHTSTKRPHEDQHRIVNEWVRKKDQDWREKCRAETLALQERLAKEQEVKELTAKMAKLKFKAWKHQKDVKEKQKTSQKPEVTVSNPGEHKELCDASYAAWLQTVKDREKRQLAFRQLIVRGAYKAKPAADRNRKQGKPQKSGVGEVTKRSILCVLYCPKNTKR